MQQQHDIGGSSGTGAASGGSSGTGTAPSAHAYFAGRAPGARGAARGAARAPGGGG